ncbi:MAG: alpha/beta hydrolase [Pseudomonadales bacterium]|nr:alpha/beta hydrolase [Pseudomonadales bacterium]
MSEIPQWFWDAVETKPETGTLEVEGADINYLYWSEAGNPGLLFVHGHNAHAHWWDFIAPSFREEYQTVALDLSGMGDSDHRDDYSMDLYAKEIVAVADELKMPEDTIVVAHSFGGRMSLHALAQHPGRFGGLVLVDSGVRHPDDERPQGVERWSKPKVYPDFETAKERFRLQPPQNCDNPWIVEYIARNSVEFDGDGWVWKFDEELNMRMDASGSTEEDFKALDCRVAEIYGEQSRYFSAKSAEYMKELKPGLEVYPMADAQHHLFLDQPLAFIESLKTVLTGWRAS